MRRAHEERNALLPPGARSSALLATQGDESDVGAGEVAGGGVSSFLPELGKRRLFFVAERRLNLARPFKAGSLPPLTFSSRQRRLKYSVPAQEPPKTHSRKDS